MLSGKRTKWLYSAGGYPLYPIKAPMAALQQTELTVNGRSAKTLDDTGYTSTLLTKNKVDTWSRSNSITVIDEREVRCN